MRKTCAAFLLLLAAGSALAAPTWLDCSGTDQRFTQSPRNVQHTIRVMFDEQGGTVHVKDGSIDAGARSVTITPVRIHADLGPATVHIDRNSAEFTYMRFRENTNISMMSGKCQRAASAPKQQF